MGKLGSVVRIKGQGEIQGPTSFLTPCSGLRAVACPTAQGG